MYTENFKFIYPQNETLHDSQTLNGHIYNSITGLPLAKRQCVDFLISHIRFVTTVIF